MKIDQVYNRINRLNKDIYKGSQVLIWWERKRPSVYKIDTLWKEEKFMKGLYKDMKIYKMRIVDNCYKLDEYVKWAKEVLWRLK